MVLIWCVTRWEKLSLAGRRIGGQTGRGVGHKEKCHRWSVSSELQRPAETGGSAGKAGSPQAALHPDKRKSDAVTDTSGAKAQPFIPGVYGRPEGRPFQSTRLNRSFPKVCQPQSGAGIDPAQNLLMWMLPSPVVISSSRPPPFNLPRTRERSIDPFTVTGMSSWMWPSPVWA